MKKFYSRAAALSVCAFTLIASAGCGKQESVQKNNDYIVNSNVSAQQITSDISSEPVEAESVPEDAVDPDLIVGGSYTVDGLTHYLALRNEPTYDTGSEIGQLKNGDNVMVTVNKIYGDSGEYCYVKVTSGSENGKEGYVNKYYLKAGASGSNKSAASSEGASSIKFASSKISAASKIASSKKSESTLTASAAASSQEESSKAKEIRSAAPSEPVEEPVQEEIIQEEPAAEVNADSELFDMIPDTFLFSSGVGGWETTMTIHSDGSFEGSFHDSDMGDAQADYPKGTMYLCDFSGKFGNVTKVDDHTYTMELLSISQEKEEGIEYIEDGLRCKYAYPYGLDNGTVFEVYLPGKPMSEISERCRSWLLGSSKDTYVPEDKCYICNVNQQYGWFS